MKKDRVIRCLLFLLGLGMTILSEFPILASASDYLFPQSNSAYLTENDVAGYSLQEINYGKNEIYARRGRKFKSKELTDYFNTKAWYSGRIEPDDFSEEYFNAYEVANAHFLSEREYEINPRGYVLDQAGYDITLVRSYPGSEHIFVQDPWELGGDISSGPGQGGAQSQNDPSWDSQNLQSQNDPAWETTNPQSQDDSFWEDTNPVIDADTRNRMLSGEIVSLGDYCLLDVDADDIPEEIHIYEPGDMWPENGGSPDFEGEYVLQIGDGFYYGVGDWVERNVYGVSLDGREILIIVYDAGPSDDPYSCFFRYHSGSLELVGDIYDYPPNMKSTGNGQLETRERCAGIDYTKITVIYGLDGNGKLCKKNGPVYSIVAKSEYLNPDCDYSVYLKQPVTLFEEMDFFSDMIQMEPQKVTFTQTDGLNWVMLEGMDGTNGWLNIQGMYTTGQRDLFDGLVDAD